MNESALHKSLLQIMSAPEIKGKEKQRIFSRSHAFESFTLSDDFFDFQKFFLKTDSVALKRWPFFRFCYSLLNEQFIYIGLFGQFYRFHCISIWL